MNPLSRAQIYSSRGHRLDGVAAYLVVATVVLGVISAGTCWFGGTPLYGNASFKLASYITVGLAGLSTIIVARLSSYYLFKAKTPDGAIGYDWLYKPGPEDQ